MNPMPQLESLLKQLRLFGILESLEGRNRQAIESKLAFTDFLSLLLQDEIIRREQRQFSQRFRKSQVGPDKTLERFDFAECPSVNRTLIAELATGRFLTDRAPILIAGPTGAGKSHLAQALGHCVLRQGHDVLFTTHNKLLALLNAARATNAFERKLQQLAKIDFIIVDDFALKPMRSSQDEDFHDLINERYEHGKANLLTSNLHFDEWTAAFPNKLLGAATLDRLRDGAYRIVLDRDSHRKPRPLPETPKSSTKTGR
jgi:DNA replication protein DnaC